MEDTPDGAPLSAGAVARRLGIAVDTLRSWDRRYGLGPGGHSPGAHRRYGPADLARLERMCRLVGEGVPPAFAARAVLAGPDGPGAPEGAEAARAGGGHTLPAGRHAGADVRGLARSAVRMDAARVVELVEGALARDGVVGAWEGTIRPALAAAGRKWADSGGRYIEVEHLLSGCVAVALHRVRTAPPAPGGPAHRGVLLACAQGEWHTLPLEALAAALAERGVPVRMLGAAVPASVLYEAVRRTGPAYAVVWSHRARTAGLPAPGRLARLPWTRVYAAGPGWAARPPLGIGVLHSLPEAVEALTGDSR